MVREYQEQNVYEALMDRFKLLFEEFDNIYVSFSGGKDSGLLLNLVLDYRNKYYPEKSIGVFHQDFEAQYTVTTEYIEKTFEKIKDQVEFVDNGIDAMQIIPTTYLFVADQSVMEEMYEDYPKAREQFGFWDYYGADLDCSDKTQNLIAGEIDAGLQGLGEQDPAFSGTSVECVGVERMDFYSMYAGMFFLGTLLGIVFLLGICKHHLYISAFGIDIKMTASTDMAYQRLGPSPNIHLDPVDAAVGHIGKREVNHTVSAKEGECGD